MRILISSHLFHPSIGGIEQVSAILADGFVSRGHQIKLITQSASADTDSFPFEVIRQPTIFQLIRLVLWCDVFFHNNISLRTAWPLLVIRRPWVVCHQTWITLPNSKITILSRLKHLLLRSVSNICVSQEIAQSLQIPSRVIGNPYRDDLFSCLKGVQRDRQLVFLGRLVSDKGVDLLIEALGRLKLGGLKPDLTIIGTGPELPALRALAERHSVKEQVNFAGAKTGRKLVELLNQHQIMVVPSRWREPFGIVALEGIACGCVVVGSEGGGLKDA
ncbi:MAG: glycosyltransferase family 4 protein, partial [Bryobacteraceae bacterium]|nr:glycosyltransferase family 4 protein [Bryobacteraceae bacterium]